MRDGRSLTCSGGLGRRCPGVDPEPALQLLTKRGRSSEGGDAGEHIIFGCVGGGQLDERGQHQSPVLVCDGLPVLEDVLEDSQHHIPEAGAEGCALVARWREFFLCAGQVRAQWCRRVRR